MSSHPSHDPHAPLPQQPHYGQPQPPAAPGQFAYPYAQQQAGVAPAQPDAPHQPIVPQEELLPVVVPHNYALAAERPMPELPGDQLYYAPAAAPRDQSRTTLAAVITFVALIIALWGILGFLSSMSKTLTSVDSGTTKLKTQLVTANDGLRALDEKTGHLNSLATDSVALKGKLGAIDGGMASMLTSIGLIATNMSAMEGSLGTLDTELGKLNAANSTVSEQLGGIRTGLGSQQKSVAGMSKDVAGTGKQLGALVPRLAASNARLAHINSTVNFMGCKGILQKLNATFYLGPIRNGGGEISATIVPPGSWGTNADGSPCQ